MTAISWILIILMFVIAFIGLVKPIIPSVLFIWIGYFIYHFAIDSSKLSWIFWVVMIVFTIFMILSDIIMNSYFVKKFGGSKLERQWQQSVSSSVVSYFLHLES